MSKLTDFPITARWPAQHPVRIRLYLINTPNGVKVSIMLEEAGLAYEPHLVDINEEREPHAGVLSLSAKGKIPASIDSDGSGGEPIGLLESGAMGFYLADIAAAKPGIPCHMKRSPSRQL